MSISTRDYVTPNEGNVTYSDNKQNDYFDICIAKIKKSNFPEIISFAWLMLWLLVIPGLFFWLNDKNISYIKDIPLNNIGDYLAGVAAPIAFLWLVLGYKQQGKELSINNDMLRLQHEELLNSVVAQNSQALSMKQQIDLLIRDKYYPKFKLENFHYDTTEDFIEIIIKNHGNDVDGISVNAISNYMVVTEEYTSNDITHIYLQTLDDIPHDFEIIIEIIFNIEIGATIKQCYQMHYNSYRYNSSVLPPLNKIVCEENK